MIGSKIGSTRCYLCRERFDRDEDTVVCEECGVRFHPSCSDISGQAYCPHCADEGLMRVLEF